MEDFLFPRSFSRVAALLASIALVAGIAPAASADTAPHLQRLIGTVGFADQPGGQKHDVVTTADLPKSAEVYAGCSSQAAISMPAGSDVIVGGSAMADLWPDGHGIDLKNGALQFDVPAALSTPMTVRTKYGSVGIRQGSGFVVTGEDGTQVIALDVGPAGVGYMTDPAGTAWQVMSGHTVTVPANSGTPGTPVISANSAVNNPAIYQFNNGRNPLGTDRVALHDPAGSPQPLCTLAGAGAGLGAGAIAAIAAGIGGVAVGIGSGGHALGGSPEPTIPPGGGTPTPSASPTGGGSPTPTPTGSGTTPTPTPTGSGSTPTPTPTASGVTPTPTASASGAPGAIVLAPDPLLLQPALGSPASGTFTIAQQNYNGPFTVSQPTCPLSVGGTPTASISGDTGTFSLPAQSAALNAICTITVTGGGGMTASESVTAIVTALAPTPTPTSSSALGPVIANPASILLAPGVGTPASQTIAVSQMGYSGPFTANVASCVGLASPPTVAVNGSTVVFSLPAQTAAADVGCNVTITGGGGMQAVVPVTITIGVVVPSPTPSATGTSAGSMPLTANPSSVVLDPGVTSPAVANIVVSPASEGPFTASVSCAVGLLGMPTVSVTGYVVSVTLPGQTISAPIGCNVLISSPSTGQRVSVPILVSATVLATPSASPSPGASAGPLTANPPSVLLDPGVTQNAQANILMSDPGYTGAYTATASCPLALSQPSVVVSGYVVEVTYPASVVTAALGCSVVVKTSIGQSVTIPLTVSATVLGASATTLAVFKPLAFRPPAMTLAHQTSRGDIDIVRGEGPFRTSTQCSAGTVLNASATSSSVSLTVLSRDAHDGDCVVSIFGAGGALGHVPVTVAGAPLGHTLPGGPLPQPARSGTLVVGQGEHKPFVLGTPIVDASGCERFADLRIAGPALDVLGRRAGACTATLRTRDGSTAYLTVIVEDRSDVRPLGGGRLR